MILERLRRRKPEQESKRDTALFRALEDLAGAHIDTAHAASSEESLSKLEDLLDDALDTLHMPAHQKDAPESDFEDPQVIEERLRVATSVEIQQFEDNLRIALRYLHSTHGTIQDSTISKTYDELHKLSSAYLASAEHERIRRQTTEPNDPRANTAILAERSERHEEQSVHRPYFPGDETIGSLSQSTHEQLVTLKTDDSIYNILRSFESAGSRKEMVTALAMTIQDELSKIDTADQKFKKDVAQFARHVAEAEKNILDIAEKNPQQLAVWASEALDHLEAEAAPLVAIAGSNPLAQLLTDIRATPQLEAALTAIEQKADKLLAPKKVSRFSNPASILTQGAALCGVGSVAFLSFLFTKVGIENATLWGLEQSSQLPGGKQIANALAQLIEYYGGSPLHFKHQSASAIGTTVSALATLTFTSTRTMKLKERKQKHRLLPYAYLAALGVSGFGAASGLIEVIYAGAGTAKYGEELSRGFSKFETAAQTLGPALKKTEEDFIRAALTAAAKEARGKAPLGKFDAFGPKTMLNLAVAGLLNPDFAKSLPPKFVESLSPELQAFLKLNFEKEFETFVTGKQNEQVFRKEWSDYRTMLEKTAKNFTALGVGTEPSSPQLIQVFRSEFAKLDSKTPTESYTNLSRRAKASGEGNLYDFFGATLHLPTSVRESLGLKDVVTMLQMISEKRKTEQGFLKLSRDYKKLRETTVSNALKYLTQLTTDSRQYGTGANRGVDLVKNLGDAFKLDKLPVSEEEIVAIAASVPIPNTKIAMTIISSQDGWDVLQSSLDKAKIPVQLSSTTAKILFVSALGSMYVGADLLPKYPIKIANRARRNRYERRMRSGYEKINDVEKEIADIVANRLNGFFRVHGAALAQPVGAATILPDEILQAHIRRKLVEQSEAACRASQNPSTITLKTFQHLRTIGNYAVALPGVALGLAPDPEEIKAYNFHAEWLDSTVRALRGGDEQAIVDLVSGIYPQYRAGVLALGNTLTAAKNSSEYNDAFTTASTSSSEIRSAIIKEALPDIELRLALLHAAQDHLASEAITSSVEKELGIRTEVPFAFTEKNIRQSYVIGKLAEEIAWCRGALGQTYQSAPESDAPAVEEVLNASLYHRASHWLTSQISRAERPSETANTPTDSQLNYAEYKTPKMQLDDVAAARDSLIRHMQSEVTGLSRADVTTETVSRYNNFMTELNYRLVPARERFEKSLPPALMGYRIRMTPRHSATIGATVVLEILDTTKTGNPDVVARADFATYEVPAVSQTISLDDTINALSDWLAPGGEASRILEARKIEHDMDALEMNIQKELGTYLTTDEPRGLIPIPFATLDGEREKIIDLVAKYRYVKRWQETYSQTLGLAERGIAPSQALLNELRTTRLISAQSAADAFFTQKDRDVIANTLQLLAENPREGIQLWYDPSPLQDADIVIYKNNAMRDRIRVSSSRGEMIEKLRSAA